MILTAHQPVYLPWLGLFHKIALADAFCFFDDVQYQPKDWNNRNQVRSQAGQPLWLSVPVMRAGYLEKSYLDIEIDARKPWQRKHVRTLELNYSKAPYFQEYFPAIRSILEAGHTHLAELNLDLLKSLMVMLGITTPIVRMSDHSFSGAKSELVLDMCRSLGAEAYIFGAQGKDYADVETFLAAGIVPVFQDYNHPRYTQLGEEFVSHLSVVDLLFNHGEESLGILMAGNLSRGELESHIAEVRGTHA